MLSKQRQLEILKQLKQKNSVRLVELSELLNVSESSIKRDLIELERQNKLKRVYGGAISIKSHQQLSVEDEFPALEKLSINEEAKKKICENALRYVRDNDVIFIDSGTTPLFLAKELMNRKVTIVTNNLLVTNLSKNLANVYLLGGKLDEKNRITSGDFLFKMLEIFHFDHCFLGANGLNLETKQACVTQPEIALLKKQVIQQSNKKYLLIDSSKYEIYAPYPYATFDQFDVIITENKGDIYENKKS